MNAMNTSHFNSSENIENNKFRYDDFKHLREIREYMVNDKQELCIERSRFITNFLKEKGGLDYEEENIREAECLKNYLQKKKANIFPHELLAGSTTAKRKGIVFYPEYMGLGMWPELATMSCRKNNKYMITIEDIYELDQEILPFWMDKNMLELIRRKVGDDNRGLRLQTLMFLFMCSKYVCQSHTIPNYQMVLDKGIVGIIEEYKERSTVSSPEQNKLFKSFIISLEGIIEYSNNLSKEALRQASQVNDEDRRIQLEKMAAICKKVPANPPTHFWEAVQSIWSTMNALYQEQNNVGFSIGRIDQLLNPYYQKDIQLGLMSRKEAFEILAHFWLKIGDNVPMIPEMGELLFAGTGSNQAITIGGCDKEGKNAVNDVTYLVLDVVELLKVRDPNLNARIRKDDPPDYTRRITEVIMNTGATPSLISDQVTIPALEKIGINLEDARDYAQVGCLEPSSPGRTCPHTGAIMFNLIGALELVLNDGNMLKAKNIGLKTGNILDFETFDQFYGAVKQQIKFILEIATTFNNDLGKILKYLKPQPLLSSLTEGTLDSGKGLLEGGAKYNSSGIAYIALADLVDSIYSVKKLVYDDKIISFKKLHDALLNDFKENDVLYHIIINKIAHFGNGIKEVDDIAVDLINFLYDESRRISNYRGGYYNPGYWSMTIHSGFGKITGAMPNGKKSGEPLTSGLTPFSLGQKSGPTAVYNSLAYLPAEKMPNGMALNMKFNKTLFINQDKIALFTSLFKAYFAKGGMQCQFIIQDADDLKKAMEKPELYPDLMVRISGYTAYFIDLNKHMQKEIIERALMEL